MPKDYTRTGEALNQCETIAGAAATASAPNMVAKALSVADMCRLYNVGRTFIFEQIRGGALTAKKAGRRTLVAADEAARWFEHLPGSRRR